MIDTLEQLRRTKFRRFPTTTGVNMRVVSSGRYLFGVGPRGGLYANGVEAGRLHRWAIPHAAMALATLGAATYDLATMLAAEEAQREVREDVNSMKSRAKRLGVKLTRAQQAKLDRLAGRES